MAVKRKLKDDAQVVKNNMKKEINLRSRIFGPTYQSLADPLHRPS